MRFAGLAYRGHNPKWTFAPTSGEGAAIHGGRFNPKGVPALYLALSPQGAFLEATQGFAFKFNPLLLCTYVIDCEDIADLTTARGLEAVGIAPQDLASPWALEVSEGKSPRSWSVHKTLAPRYAGIIVPSFAVGARPEFFNLVLWRWSDQPPHAVSVHDPEHLLPRDQSSWPERTTGKA